MPEFVPQPTFVRLVDTSVIVRSNEHGGLGDILFRRLLSDKAFESAIDFVDVTVIKPGSSIGCHQHLQTEEIYFIVSGTPVVTVADSSCRLTRGDMSVVHSGQWHELVNDTSSDVEIFVVQVHL